MLPSGSWICSNRPGQIGLTNDNDDGDDDDDDDDVLWIMKMVMMMMCSGWRGVVEGKLREKTLCVGGGASFQ